MNKILEYLGQDNKTPIIKILKEIVKLVEYGIEAIVKDERIAEILRFVGLEWIFSMMENALRIIVGIIEFTRNMMEESDETIEYLRRITETYINVVVAILANGIIKTISTVIATIAPLEAMKWLNNRVKVNSRSNAVKIIAGVSMISIIASVMDNYMVSKIDEETSELLDGYKSIWVEIAGLRNLIDTTITRVMIAFDAALDLIVEAGSYHIISSRISTEVLHSDVDSEVWRTVDSVSNRLAAVVLGKIISLTCKIFLQSTITLLTGGRDPFLLALVVVGLIDTILLKISYARSIRNQWGEYKRARITDLIIKTLEKIGTPKEKIEKIKEKTKQMDYNMMSQHSSHKNTIGNTASVNQALRVILPDIKDALKASRKYYIGMIVKDVLIIVGGLLSLVYLKSNNRIISTAKIASWVLVYILDAWIGGSISPMDIFNILTNAGLTSGDIMTIIGIT